MKTQIVDLRELAKITRETNMKILNQRFLKRGHHFDLFDSTSIMYLEALSTKVEL